MAGNLKIALSEKIALLLHRNLDVPCSLVVTYPEFGWQIVSVMKTMLPLFNFTIPGIHEIELILSSLKWCSLINCNLCVSLHIAKILTLRRVFQNKTEPFVLSTKQLEPHEMIVRSKGM